MLKISRYVVINALCAHLSKELVWYNTKIMYVIKKLQYKVTLFY